MSKLPSKFDTTLNEAVARLLGRATNSRGLSSADVRPRIERAIEKYLFRDSFEPPTAEVRSFVDDMRADDLCLIISCENGDERSWEELVSNFDSAVRSAARRISSNNDDADDLAGSIWAELYGLREDDAGRKKSKLAYYSGRGSLAGWLRAVVAQLAVDEFRKQSRFVQIEEPRDLENLAENASGRSNNDIVIHHELNPEDLFTEKEASSDVSSALTSAIKSLKPEDRLLLKLYYFDDLKLKEIAVAFGYHEATASRKIVRIQAEIRKFVERDLHKIHGWSESEIKRSLSEAASTIGISVERLVTLLAVGVMLQETLLQCVL